MVVHHTHGRHKRVGGGRAEEVAATLLQIFAERPGSIGEAGNGMVASIFFP